MTNAVYDIDSALLAKTAAKATLLLVNQEQATGGSDSGNTNKTDYVFKKKKEPFPHEGFEITCPLYIPQQRHLI